jgi:hypothetical protein
MKLSLKKTLVGVGLTAGATLLIHNRIESGAHEREKTYTALVGCSQNLGRVGCTETIISAGIQPDMQTADDQSITYTYNPEDIISEANNIRNNDETGFQYFIYPATVITGLALTISLQDRRTRSAIANHYR